MRDHLRAARRLEATKPPAVRDAVRLLVAGRTRHRARSLRPTWRLPGARRPPRRQHVGHPGGRHRRDARRRATGHRSLRHRTRRRHLGRRDPAARPPRRGRMPDTSSGDVIDAARRRTAARRRGAPPRADPPVAEPDRSRRTDRGLSRPERPADPLRLRAARVPPERSTRPCSPASRAAPRCPAPAGPSPTELVTQLVTRGVVIAPITLHTGVSSQDPGEPPQPERYRVPAATARLVNLTRAGGSRVVAVGTTVTRALESAADRDGTRTRAQRLDGPRPRRRSSRASRGRPDHRLARPRRVSPGAAAGRRRHGVGAAGVRRGVGCGIPLARVRRQLPATALTRPCAAVCTHTLARVVSCGELPTRSFVLPPRMQRAFGIVELVHADQTDDQAAHASRDGSQAWAGCVSVRWVGGSRRQRLGASGSCAAV